jgi:transcriptional regulator with XRE-family HTH domain
MKITNRNASTADRLRQALEEANMKQIELSRCTGIDRSAINRYLSGTYEPKQDAIHKMAQALNVSEMWLWGCDVPKERTPAQKKNDGLVQVIAQLRKAEEFFEVVQLLAELPAEQYASVKSIISALGNK